MKKIIIATLKLIWICANGFVIMWALLLMDSAYIDELYDWLLLGILLPSILIWVVKIKWGYDDVWELLHCSDDDDL